MPSNRLTSSIATAFFCLAVTMVATKKISAVPASPRIHILTQADGATFLARQRGDEWGSIWQTIDKYTIVFDKTTQNWMYAILDIEGKSVPSTNVVIKDPPLCRDDDSGIFTKTCPTVTSLYQEKDGTTFLARRWKEKGEHGWETEDGYTFIFDEATQSWRYAIHDVEGRLVLSSNRVGKDSPPAGVELHLRPIKSQIVNSNPTFQDSILMIPSVDLPERGGAYQNVKFKLIEEGEWQLLGFLKTKELQYIDKVEIIKTDSFPIQVFLKVTGNFTSGCQEMGQISFKLLKKRFNIWMYSTQDQKFSTGEFACTAGFSPFTHILPLPIYSLKKGEYEYSVNGRHTGTFHLAEDNKL